MSKPAVMYQDSFRLSVGTFDIVWDFLVSFGTLGVMFQDLSIFRDFLTIFWDVMLSNGTLGRLTEGMLCETMKPIWYRVS